MDWTGGWCSLPQHPHHCGHCGGCGQVHEKVSLLWFVVSFSTNLNNNCVHHDFFSLNWEALQKAKQPQNRTGQIWSNWSICFNNWGFWAKMVCQNLLYSQNYFQTWCLLGWVHVLWKISQAEQTQRNWLTQFLLWPEYIRSPVADDHKKSGTALQIYLKNVIIEQKKSFLNIFLLTAVLQRFHCLRQQATGKSAWFPSQTLLVLSHTMCNLFEHSNFPTRALFSFSCSVCPGVKWTGWGGSLLIRLNLLLFL